MRTWLILFATCNLASADDAERARRAKAALALAAPAVSVAPAPRPAPLNYDPAYRLAVSERKPLLVFVGQVSEVNPKAVTARVNEYPGVTGPAVVVGFAARDGKVYVHAIMKWPTPIADLDRALAEAAKKVDRPTTKESPATRPLDWSDL
jgi:hypothetical protein